MGLDNNSASPSGSQHRFKNTLLATCVEIQTSLGTLQKIISSVSTPQEFVCKRHIFQALLSVAAAIRKIPELKFQNIPSISHTATDPTKNIVMRFQACLTEVVNKMAVLREYIESTPSITNALSIGQILQVIKDKLILVPPEPTPIDSATTTTTEEDEDDEDTYYDAHQDVQPEPTSLPSPRRNYPIISVTIPSSNPLSSSDSPVSTTSSSSSPSSTPSSSSSPPPLHLESLLATSRSEPGLGQTKPPTLQKYLTSPELTNRREVGMKKSFSLFNMNIKKGPRPEQEIHVFNPLYGKKIDYGLISQRIKEGKLKQSYNVTTKLFRNSYKYNTPQDWLSPIKPDQTTRSIFGTPLNLVPSTTKGVPLFLEEAFHYLQSIQDLDFQSLVQSQVPLLEVLQYQKGIERGMKLETLPVDPPLVFALVKQFLSLLPDSLICLSIYHDVIQLQGVTPLQTKLSLLKDIILSLPLNHIYSLQLIIQFLNEISLHLSLSSSASAISSLSILGLSRSQSSSPSSSPSPSPRVSSSPVPSPRTSSPSSSPHMQSRSSPRNISQDKRQSIVNQPNVNSPMQSSGSYSKSKKSISSTFAPLLLRKENSSQDHAAKVDIINTMIHNYNYLFETRTSEMAYEIQAGAYIVVAASPRMVAQKLVDPFYSEPDFVDAILLTYSYFSTATELLNMMISIYTTEFSIGSEMLQSKYRLRILYVINLWLQRNILRLKGDGDFCQTLSKFGSTTSPSPSEKPFFSFLHQWIKKNYSPHATLKSTKSKMMSTPARYTSFLEFGVDHIAHQMIYIDNKLFRAMKFSDFLHKNFVTPTSSPGFTLMMQRFNLWGGWVASEIVSEKVQSSRAKIISFFIRVAQVCLEMQSYNTAYAVIAGLGNSSVERLRLTWVLIDDEVMEMYSKLQEVFDMSKNYLNYRTFLHNSVPPLVPYLGLYPKDLFAIEENLPGRTNDNLVQITKLRKLHEVIRPLLDYQLGKNYVIKSDRVAHQYLKKINPLDSEAIYQYSLVCEPRASHT